MATQTILTEKEASELAEKVANLAKEVLVFNKIKYIETKTFERDNSVYHIFGVYNEGFNCWNKVTYCSTDKSMEFAAHPIRTIF